LDRKSFSFYHNFMGFPKVTVGEISGYALGGGFEMALMTDISVIARDTKIGMPSTRFLGPALRSSHMFFHRLGPVLARRMLLTGNIIEAGEIEHLGIFTDTCDPGAVTGRARYWAEKAAKMPADGVVIAKEAFRLVEQTQAYQGEVPVPRLRYQPAILTGRVQLRQNARTARDQGSVPVTRRTLPRAGTGSLTMRSASGQH
jgi:enoyl-CoA hydratase